MPAVTHVVVTVTDLAVSEEWYTTVLGIKPVIDEDTGPFRHIVYELGNTLFALHGFIWPATSPSTNAGRVSITSRSAARTAASSWNGPLASTSSASPTVTSSMRDMDPACRSAIRTTSPSSYSPRRPEQLMASRATSTHRGGATAPFGVDRLASSVELLRGGVHSLPRRRGIAIRGRDRGLRLGDRGLP
jgi:hypothetical protein